MSHWFVATDTAGHSFKIRRIEIDQVVNVTARERLRDEVRRLAVRLPVLRGRAFEQFAGLEESSDGLDLVHIWVETENYAATPLPREAAAAIADLAEAAAALDEAHRLGIVHGALRPAVILRAADRILVTEFLVERAVYGFAVEADPFAEGRYYESPEQVQETGESAASDQFALAAIAYLWLTGRKPFEADNIPTLHYRICREQPPAPKTLNSGLSEAASEAILKGLAKRAEDRFPSCMEFVAALGRAQGFELPRLGAAAVVGGTRLFSQSFPQAGGTVTVPIAAREVSEPILSEQVQAEPFAVPSFGRGRDATTRRRQTTELRRSGAGRWLRAAFLAGLVAAGVIWLWKTWTPPPVAVQQAADALPGLSQGELKAPEAGNSERGSAPPAAERGREETIPLPARPGGTSRLRGRHPAGTAPSPSGPGATARAAAGASPTEASRPSPVEAPPSPKPGPAEVRIVSTPIGARVTLDGDQSQTCTAPCSIEASFGRHTLTATVPGYGVAKRIFNVPQDEDIVVDLQPNAGLLLVTSEPSGAVVLVDGQEAGRTPASLRLAVGQHRLIVILSGYLRAEDTVNISPEQLTSRTYRW